MSIKSRKTKERISKNAQTAGILSKQKQTIKNAFLDYMLVAIFFFVLAVSVFAVGLNVEDEAHSQRIIFGATPIVLCIVLFYFCLSVRRLLIYKKFYKIKSSAHQTVEIICKRVRFIIQSLSRNNVVLICIIFVDENGKKYHYITEIWDYDAKGIKKSLQNAKVSLDCYANTTYVKAFKVLDNIG